jgi:O-antigen/teichoic acid export membrane protein
MAQPAAPDSTPDDEDAPDYVARILKGSGSVFSGSMIGKVVGFTLSLVLGRGLGSVLFGKYTLGLTVLRIAQSVSTLGLQNGIVRFGAPSYERGETARVKGTFLAGGGLGVLTALAIGVALFLGSHWLAYTVFQDPAMEQVVEVFACGLPFYVLTYLLSRMARALSKMQVDVLLDSILQPAFFLVLVGGVLAVGQGFTAALYAFLLSTVLAAGAGIYALYRLFPPLLSSLPADLEIRSLLRFSLPIVGVTLASIGLTYTDRIMLGILSTSESVGLYQIAARLSEQLRFVLFAITAAFSPVISDLYHNDRISKLSDLYANTVRWILLTTLPAAVLLIAFAPQVMGIWGPDYRDGATLLRVLAVAHIVTAGVGTVGHMLQMSDHQDFVFAVNTSMAVLNVGLNWLFINVYGALGAALATGFIQVLGNVLQSIALYRFTGIQPFRLNLWKPLAAASLGTLFAWSVYNVLAVPMTWVVGVPGTLVIYVGALLSFGLTPKDRSILQALWSRLQARVG